eukprot:scaffold34005_cov63-Phaeocystis_antarctica.AAC.2
MRWSCRAAPPRPTRTRPTAVPPALQLQGGEQVHPPQQPVAVAVVESPQEAELLLERRRLGESAEDEILLEARTARARRLGAIIVALDELCARWVEEQQRPRRLLQRGIGQLGEQCQLGARQREGVEPAARRSEVRPVPAHERRGELPPPREQLERARRPRQLVGRAQRSEPRIRQAANALRLALDRVEKPLERRRLALEQRRLEAA